MTTSAPIVEERTDTFTVWRAGPHAALQIAIHSWSGSVRQAMQRYRPTHVTVAPDYQSQALDGLAEFASHLAYLNIDARIKKGLAVVNDLRGLTELWIRQEPDVIDFGALLQLQRCILRQTSGVGSIAAAKELRHLQLFETRVQDFRGLRGIPPLEELTVNDSRVFSSVDGIEAIRVSKLALNYARKLQSIGALDGHDTLSEFSMAGGKTTTKDMTMLRRLPKLESFFLQSAAALLSFEVFRKSPQLRVLVLQNTAVDAKECSLKPLADLPLTRLRLHPGPGPSFRCLADIEALADIRTLEVLEIGKGPKLASLSFLRSLKRLRSLKLTSMEIADGDLSPLLDLPALEEVVIQPALARYKPPVAQVVRASRERASS